MRVCMEFVNMRVCACVCVRVCVCVCVCVYLHMASSDDHTGIDADTDIRRCRHGYR